MKHTKYIEHEGVINEIKNNTLKISIKVNSACISCNLKSSCSVSETKEKNIYIENENNKLSEGDKVYVVLKQTLAYKALFLGYILPFIFVLVTLFTASYITKNEAISGIISIFILIPYYFILYKQKEKINKKFKFYLKNDYNTNP